MVERRRLSVVPKAAPVGNDYFLPERALTFIPSGCTVLDCVLGGGWPLGRMSNIVGDKSTGKTLLAIEACANFAHNFPKGKIFYREAEAAFDVDYARTLGLPVTKVDFGPKGIDSKWDTVEDVFEDIQKHLDACATTGRPTLYIVDSLDALSSRPELKRSIDKGSYGTEKAKIVGQLFRVLGRELKAMGFHLMIVSQIRDKIGVTFGEKKTRTGGHAMDFYASQILWLSHLGILNRTIGGVKRATGVRIKAKCKKNKIAAPFRDCEMDIEFGYGVRDLEASFDWLEEVKGLKYLDPAMKPAQIDDYLQRAYSLPTAELIEQQKAVRVAVLKAWQEIEGRFAPSRRKYE